MKLFVFLLAFVFILVVGGCSSYKPPSKYNYKDWADYWQDYDYVWSKIIQFFGQTGIQIKNMDKSSGFIATEMASFSGGLGTYLDCGEPGSALFYLEQFERPYGYFNIIVTKQSENITRVQVKTFYKVYYVIYRYTDYGYTKMREYLLDCNSTGYLEKVLLNFIEN
ncbi:MAG: hypothetical protein N2517_08345 [Ignavibacteria bacterium]|nr:hypothetical protein [Ignavibacteria bacterium]